MIQCCKCEDYYPSENMCLSPEDKTICQWCAQQERHDKPQWRFTCDWCGEPGVKIGIDYGHLMIVKCTACHHEWVAPSQGSFDEKDDVSW